MSQTVDTFGVTSGETVIKSEIKRERAREIKSDTRYIFKIILQRVEG